ncbi:hypothetical protein [uncultured Cloacibacillus sp.]|uniref:hypothetical protein n=1 Tax=uncultured Cloacibacillus sp. TaxID=889794 RepID=UPI0027D9C537|nr:hypothetical protein [uncultured Cloacibacillus sp.]
MVLLRRCFICFIFVACCLFFSLAAAPAFAVSSHLIPLPAVNFDTPSPKTANAELSQKEYEQKISSLEKICGDRYNVFAQTLSEEKKAALSISHARWREFLFSLQETLNRQLNTPVKVFYGIKERERVTNIYRDAAAAVYEQRISDLERWSRGDFSPLKIGDPDALKVALAYEENLFNERASRCVYLMEERYRLEEFTSQKAWRDFREAQLSFIKKMTDDRHALSEENLLMLRRINDIRALQAEGLVFFKQEREE